VLLAASTFAVGFANHGWCLAPTLAIASAAGFIVFIGNGIQWAALISAVQRLTPEHLQGRLMGAVESLRAIFPAFGYGLGSAITVLASPRIALLVAGVGVCLCTIAFVRIPFASKGAGAENSPGEDKPAGAARRERAWTAPHDDTSPQVGLLADSGAQLSVEKRSGAAHRG
jgi:MFS family permease